jgi:hypothetical protein
MSARIGADDLVLFEDPQPSLLQRVSGIKPESGGLHVLLDEHGSQSTQRLALSRFPGGLIAALWPAELKTQAIYLYGNHLSIPMVARARDLGWTAEPAPQLAFRNSAPEQRLYMKTAVDALDYARRWENGDLRWVGQYKRAEVIGKLWPWLKERGYANDRDDTTLFAFLETRLGNRPAFMRPGLRLHRRWDDQAASSDDIAATVRSEVNAVLAAANEPPLRSGR